MVSGFLPTPKFNKVPSKFELSWEGVEHHANLIAQALGSDLQFRNIVALARGGLIPAAMLAQRLNVRRIHNVCLRHYDDNNQRLDRIECLTDMAPFRLLNYRNTLIVDDVSDSGKSIELVKEYLPDAIVVTLVAKPEGAPLVNLYAQALSQDTWVHFPWEPKLRR